MYPVVSLIDVNTNIGEVKKEGSVCKQHKAFTRTDKDPKHTGLFISPSGISELDCATTKTDTAERSISIGRESLQVFFWY